GGGPHDHIDALKDVDGGRMDGYMGQVRDALRTSCNRQRGLFAPRCHPNGVKVDVMGYHDAREIPNYWTYAREFVLQDHMFEPDFGPSQSSHLYLVSGWSARCTHPPRVSSCHTELTYPDADARPGFPDYLWTDLTYLLHRHGV